MIKMIQTLGIITVFFCAQANAAVISGPVSGGVSISDELTVLDGAFIDGSIVWGGTGKILNIEGGTITGDLVASGFEHIVTISGGSFIDFVWSGLDYEINISGGSLGRFIFSGSGHVFNITGYGLNFDTASRFVTGTLLDGTDINFNVAFGATVNLIDLAAVPEPSSYLLFGLGLLGIGLLRNRKKA